MAVQRKEVDRITYKGHLITATLLGPDLLGYVDGVEMANMYMDTGSLFKVAKKAIDETEAEKEKLVKSAKPKKEKGK